MPPIIPSQSPKNNDSSVLSPGINLMKLVSVELANTGPKHDVILKFAFAFVAKPEWIRKLTLFLSFSRDANGKVVESPDLQKFLQHFEWMGLSRFTHNPENYKKIIGMVDGITFNALGKFCFADDSPIRDIETEIMKMTEGAIFKVYQNKNKDGYDQCRAALNLVVSDLAKTDPSCEYVEATFNDTVKWWEEQPIGRSVVFEKPPLATEDTSTEFNPLVWSKEGA